MAEQGFVFTKPWTRQPPKRMTSTSDKEPVLLAGKKAIFTAGRPPWYDTAGQQVEPFVIGVCGGSASGKTTVANKIISSLCVPWVAHLSMDSFYKGLTESQHQLAAHNQYNFDHPDAIDFKLLLETLQRLKGMKKVEVPIYNFVTHQRESKSVPMYGANVIIFEGILAFHSEAVRNILDMKVFVDTDSDIRLMRRLKRDINERGFDMNGVLQMYEKYVKPAYDNFIAPNMKHANVIIPFGRDNDVAVDMIVQHVKTQLDNKGFQVRSMLAEGGTSTVKCRPPSLHLLPSTEEVQDLHKTLRSRDTPRGAYMLHSDRLFKLVLQHSLHLLPDGARRACRVSIIHSGEHSGDVCGEVMQSGRILIRQESGEPYLLHLELPENIRDCWVLLLDATVATGAAAMMAIRVLLDHDVPEESISMLSLLMSELGVQTISYAFPGVHIVTSAVDPGVDDRMQLVPGIGCFGERYFGTDATIPR